MAPGRVHQRIVFIVESPFSERDAERFGVRRLLDRGLLVEVWDVSQLTLPKSRLQWSAASDLVRIVECASIDAFASLADDLGDRDACVLLSLVTGHGGKNGARILTDLSRTEATLGTISSGHLPDPSWASQMLCTIGSIARDTDSASEFARKLRGRVRGWTGELLHLSTDGQSDPEDRGPIRPLDRIWAGTNVDSIDSTLIGQNTLVKYLHTLDYDSIIDLSITSPSSGEFVLMLDSMGPMHPDLVTHGLRYSLDMSTYSSRVIDHLDRLEQSVGLPTVVAAHPRAQPGSLEPWYGGRDVVYRSTPELVSQSRLVVAATDSTSLGMAVAMRRPISIVTGVPLLPENRMYLSAYIRSLRLGPDSVASPKRNWRVPLVDDAAYSAFVSRYMKRPGTPYRHFWEVVADDLIGSSGQSGR